ncbi:unnamed protein product [Protopolystoma xenopodis]|uniref:ATP-dependent RNA helicase n=1 Tax=Protopolystoma xenopodis TaxID=117903 RepID=A0A448XJV0_9PLAT|nr:unnamed protein product [Protopolystoma xenopodis]
MPQLPAFSLNFPHAAFYYEVCSLFSNSHSLCFSSSTADFEIETNYHENVESFDALNLKETLLRGIYSYGYENPSAIQQRAIKPCIQGRDVLAQAQSGTGKTATFTIGILQRIDNTLNAVQALVLVPTRELAKQIQVVGFHFLILHI